MAITPLDQQKKQTYGPDQGGGEELPTFLQQQQQGQVPGQPPAPGQPLQAPQTPPPSTSGSPTAPPMFTSPRDQGGGDTASPVPSPSEQVAAMRTAAPAPSAPAPFTPPAPAPKAFLDMNDQEKIDYWTSQGVQLLQPGSTQANPIMYEQTPERMAAGRQLFTGAQQAQEQQRAAQNASAQQSLFTERKAEAERAADAFEASAGYFGGGAEEASMGGPTDYTKGAQTRQQFIDSFIRQGGGFDPATGAQLPGSNAIAPGGYEGGPKGLSGVTLPQAGAGVPFTPFDPKNQVQSNPSASANMAPQNASRMGFTPPQASGAQGGIPGQPAQNAPVSLQDLGGLVEKNLGNPSVYDDETMRRAVAQAKSRMQDTIDEGSAAVDADTAARGLFFGSNNVVDKAKLRERAGKSLGDYESNLMLDRARTFGSDRAGAMNDAFSFLQGGERADMRDMEMARLAASMGEGDMDSFIRLISSMGGQTPDFGDDSSWAEVLGSLMTDRTSAAGGQQKPKKPPVQSTTKENARYGTEG